MGILQVILLWVLLKVWKLKVTLASLKHGNSLLSIVKYVICVYHVHLCDGLETVHKAEWPLKWLVFWEESPQFTIARVKKDTVSFMLLLSPEWVLFWLTENYLAISSDFLSIFFDSGFDFFAREQVLNIIGCLSLYVVKFKIGVCKA